MKGHETLCRRAPKSISKVLLLFLFTQLFYSISYAFPDTLWVDSRSSAVLVGPSNLLNGVNYEIEVLGTHTKFSAFNWGQGACPGSESIAIFPNGANTSVGRDISFKFGGPSCCTGCPGPPGSAGNSDFRFSIDGSAPGLNFITLGGSIAYSPTHQYTSNITGLGQAIRIRFVDTTHNDNSGRYRIVIRESALNAIPTVSQWGLILFGLVLLCFGAIALHKRGAAKALQEAG